MQKYTLIDDNLIKIAKPQRKASGAIILEGNHVADTVQCCHCGTHWIPVKGSGKVRGWCLKCNGMTCGGINCMVCLTQEQRLEGIERRETLSQTLQRVERQPKIYV